MSAAPERREPSTSGADVDGLAPAVARLRRALRQAARIADPGNQLSVAQLELLSVLAEHPGARPSELAQLLHLRPNTVTTIVNVLAEQSMITRSAADGDRRAIALSVTTSGTQALQTWQATNAAVLHLALSTLPARQRTLLANAVPAIDALVQAIQRLADNASAEANR